MHAPRRPLLTRVAGVVALSLSSLALAGCGATEVPSYDVAPAQRADCRAMLDAVPNALAGKFRTEITGSRYAAGWEGGLVVRCGVPQPEVDPTAICNVANGVSWYAAADAADDQDQPVVLTTVGRTPAVELTVPGPLRPPAAAMAELAGAIKAHTEVASPRSREC